MKKNVAFIISTILLIGILFISCGEDASNDSLEQETESVPIVYEDNEVINKYIYCFNIANPDNVLSSDFFEKYYHHGKEHDNQIIMHYEDSIEVVVSDHAIDEVDVVITGNDATNNSFKDKYLMFARGFDQNLSDEKLEEYWTEALNNDSITMEFDEFEIQTRSYEDKIEFVQITGSISMQ